MLKDWGRGNRTTKELFKHLKEMGHLQAMDALKEHVPEKYHSAINMRTQETAVKRAGFGNSSSRIGVAPPPPPPCDFNQARQAQALAPNMDYSSNKSYNQKKIENIYDGKLHLRFKQNGTIFFKSKAQKTVLMF